MPKHVKNIDQFVLSRTEKKNISILFLFEISPLRTKTVAHKNIQYSILSNSYTW